jgi:hypothetical protein
MLLLGSERVITQDYKTHGDAEDYAGEHLSPIKIKGKALVTRVINKYKTHEDTINYNDFLNNRTSWKDGTYYNCHSITGKVVRYHQSELGGNQVELECYDSNKKIHIRLLHMASVLVSVGDIIDSNTDTIFMLKNSLKHARTCIYNVNYHIVWSVKYRKAVLNGRKRGGADD